MVHCGTVHCSSYEYRGKFWQWYTFYPYHVLTFARTLLYVILYLGVDCGTLLGIHFGAADAIECEALVLGLDEHRCATHLQISNTTCIDKTANQREYRLVYAVQKSEPDIYIGLSLGLHL